MLQKNLRFGKFLNCFTQKLSKISYYVVDLLQIFIEYKSPT